MIRLVVHAAVWLIVAVVFVPLTVAMAVADWWERRRFAHDFAHDEPEGPARIVLQRGPHGYEIAEEYDPPLPTGEPRPMKRAARKPTRGAGPGSTSPEPGSDGA